MAITETGRMTQEEFRALPEGPPYYEFEEGELIPMGSPTIDHQDLVGELASLLRRVVRERKLGRVCMGVDVYLPDGRVYIPDISFISAERVDALLRSPDRKIHGAPDLAVEVTSSNPERDRVRKFRVYYENGVPWYWIVDGETLAIEEYRATPEGYLRVGSTEAGELFRPRLFPELEIDLAALVSVEATSESEN